MITNNTINDILVYKKPFPYYIVAPSYSQQSAGIKVLHYLCHHLNILGYPAFLVPENNSFPSNPNLVTPIMDVRMFQIHRQHNLTPIVIYSDVINRNKLNATCFVNYLLHYPGFLSQDKSFEFSDLIFTYSQRISNYVANANLKSKILFMPIVDTSIFYPPSNNNKRSGMIYYASKYKNNFKEKTFEITDNATEITGGLPDSPSIIEVANLLRNAEVFATYEDTSLITEAILCGCPVLLIKNKYFDGNLIASYELGQKACFTEYSDENLEIAKSQINQAQQDFYSSIEVFKSHLKVFIEDTQNYASKINFPTEMNQKSFYKKFNFKKVIKYKISNKINNFIKKYF